MACLAVLAFAFLQNTWVVDDGGGPGVNFTDIPPAVAAAADGDILLVQPGTYSHFVLTGKGLRILGSGSSNTIVQNTGTTLTTSISGLPSTSIAYVDRLTIQRSSPNNGGILVLIQGSTTQAAIADCVLQGLGRETALRVVGAALWLFHSTVNGGSGTIPFSVIATGGGNALEAQTGAFVSASGSTLRGGNASNGFSCDLFGGLDGGRGASIQGGSEAWIAETDVIGGDGVYAPICGFPDLGKGGTALFVDSSTARVSGGPAMYLLGGNPGCPNSPVGFLYAGEGILTTGPSTVVVHSVTVSAGSCPGLCGLWGICSAAATIGPGIQMLAPPLPVLDVSGDFTLSGGSATLLLANGPPNALFFVGVTGVPDHVDSGPLFLGEFLVDPTAVFPFFSGVLSVTGAAFLTIPLTGLPPSFAYFPFHFQGIALDPGGAFWRLSSSTVATLRP